MSWRRTTEDIVELGEGGECDITLKRVAYGMSVWSVYFMPRCEDEEDERSSLHIVVMTTNPSAIRSVLGQQSQNGEAGAG